MEDVKGEADDVQDERCVPAVREGKLARILDEYEHHVQDADWGDEVAPEGCAVDEKVLQQGREQR